MPRKMAIPRHQVTIWESVSMASSAILSFVYFLMTRKERIISEGPAANAVVMNFIGIIEWNHMGLEGMVLMRNAVTVCMERAQTMEMYTSGVEKLLLTSWPISLL